VFVVAAGLLLSVTLIIDLVLQRPGIDQATLWLLLAFCLTFTMSALLLGERFPPVIGLICVMVFIAATIYFVSPWGDEQSAVSSAQELPILALYLGWFVRRPLGRIIMLVSTALIVVAVAANPLFRSDGLLGVPTAVQTIIVALLCFEVGSLLWRWSERRIDTDVLTGALSRTAFLERLDRKLSRIPRAAPFCLVVMDFDDFKQLNDTQGHAAGDAALIATVEGWRSGIRAGDVVGRTGGDEFALILDRLDARDARPIVERLRRESPHSWSWGIAQALPGDDGETIFGRADRALYEMKRERA
jgi:diguanylate cyclase (GGDEF)-like protein